MPTTKCLICSKSFYIKPSHVKLGWGKYCSNKCRTQSQLKGKYVGCNICGKLIYRSRGMIKHSKSKLFFCSKSCQTQWRNKIYIGQDHPNWQSGIDSYRQALIRSGRQRICVSCGINDPRILTAHHLDHNRENNNLSNLVWLFFNCHFLVHQDTKIEPKLTNTQNK